MRRIPFGMTGGGRTRARLGAWTGDILGAWAAADRRHRDRVRLAGLPDHLLADIGVTRDAVRGPSPGAGY